jgi:membrane protease YdiL (CAAX protease family)
MSLATLSNRQDSATLENPGVRLKLSAILEVLGLYVLGSFLAAQIESWRGQSFGAMLQSALQSNPPDWVAASKGWLEFLGLRYACLLVPALILGWWRRKAGRTYYGLTRSGHSVGSLVGIGLLGFAVVGTGFLLLDVARQVFSLGLHPGLLGRYIDQPWTWEFWLFLAVASFGFQPAIEELFYRAYAQTRLTEAYGGAGAIVIVSALNALGHNQYHQLTFMGVATILLVLGLNIGIGYIYWRYRSLLPCIIIHGLVNVPAIGVYEQIELAALLVVLIVFRRQLLGRLRDFCDALRVNGWAIPALIAAAIASAASIGFQTSPRRFAALAALGLVVAISIPAYDRLRRQRANRTRIPAGSP